MEILEVDPSAHGPSPEASPDCDLLRHLSSRTWVEIRDGEQMGIRVGEESITDRLLLDLALGLPQTKVIKWNRIEEGRATGADWDWWFVEPGIRAGVGLRIQAKRIDYFNQEFNGLASSNRLGPQRKMLQRSADAAGLHPLYCFYLASREPRSGRTLCLSYGSGKAPPGWSRSPNELYGCSLVGPGTVESAVGVRDPSLDFFWDFLLPLSCLFCCGGLGGGLIERVDAQARRLRGLSAEFDDRFPEPLITESLPPEVWAVLERDVDLAAVSPPDVAATVVTVAPDRHRDDE